ncbi:MAG: PhzF family phenazine biosynthesis protein [Bacteroidales bacterium]|jgi:hypothetical protein|nr:PhzF family phenazine biosynthesis protein [Bacteroidales bacterium]MDD2265031.1 PhzF family phenazine biosynthesis protein [Bacteroidales bacterium]MDD2832217.1 PhzF family phenazine biosynthesis protein [Bacteroidales bacterium]MDD4474019.1 PhzF family phenazine biosynthesis protein [Bacteroidales bacterium]MDD5046996.1 PhzF family phenazine biosynthesis protein [Bacteroidales bacterium]
MKDNRTIYQVDAFTDEPFKGNPAGVMIVDERTTAGWMQNRQTLWSGALPRTRRKYQKGQVA